MAAPRPEHAHATARPATATPLPRPAHTTTGWRQDRRPVVSKRPLHRLAAAKMSPHIHIGPEPVLAAHARSPPAAGSRCPAGADSAPHSEQNFFCIERGRATVRDAKGTRRSRRRGVADHRRLVGWPRATHIPACTLAPSPAGGGLRLGRKRLGPRLCRSFSNLESTRPIFQRIRRIRKRISLVVRCV